MANNETTPPPATAANFSAQSAVETIKENSDHLRGGIADGLADDATGALREDDTALIKFHGIYQQDNRDHREQRARRKLEPDYSFMLRLRVPSGLLTADQYLAVHHAAATLTETGSLRLTTRQTLQFHGIPKTNLRPLVQACHQQLLDSIAACGDVNRNVMCSPHPALSAAHRAAHDTATAISDALLPATRAYYEIWLGEERLANSGEYAPDKAEVEPLYKKHYLPRKFKIGIAVPPANDIDVYSQDIGYIAVVENGELRGFNILAGGGLGTTHSDPRTYPRLGSDIGFCTPEQAVDIAWHIAAWQRDHGNRSERKNARLKYTIDRRGLGVFKKELAERLGYALQPARQITLTQRNDSLGWRQREDGLWDLGIFIENGRIAADSALQNALQQIAEKRICQFMMTPNQNLMLIGLDAAGKQLVETTNLSGDHLPSSGLRENAMACVSLPTCPLAMAEAERYLPSLVTLLEKELGKHNLEKDPIVIRMTGCPNGCARPYLAEIGLVGKSPGRYNLYLGASSVGDRLGELAGENMNEKMLLEKLSPLLADYAHKRKPGESFGDYIHQNLEHCEH